MKIQIVPSGMGAEQQYQYLVSYVVNETVTIDAGSLGFGLCLGAQKQVAHIFLTHCHLDHIASLPIFLDNVYEYGPGCVTIHGNIHVLDVLQRDILNDRVWPDFVSLSTPASPFLRLNPIGDYQTEIVDDLRVTALPLKHIVPTHGFLIEDDQSAVAVISDTAAGSGVWTHLNKHPKLKAVLLECSFPDKLGWLADKAYHLTPSRFAQEISHLPPRVKALAVHIKPAWFNEVIPELQALQLPDLEIAEVGVEYEF